MGVREAIRDVAVVIQLGFYHDRRTVHEGLANPNGFIPVVLSIGI